MVYDTIIKNGYLIDPEQNIQGRRDIAIQDGKIAAVENNISSVAKHIYNAEHYLVLPGLIDAHAHVFHNGTEYGIPADLSMLPQGVTTVVDGGSAGIANFKSFMQDVVYQSRMKVFAMLNVSSAGQMTYACPEDLEPARFNIQSIKQIVNKYSEKIVSIKVRQGAELVAGSGTEPLKQTIEIAKQVGKPVTVHVTNAPCPQDELVKILREGDVFCHAFHGCGHSIIDDDGNVLPGIMEARKRGVLFEVANGRKNFTFKVAKAALSERFTPDLLGSDLTTKSLYMENVFGLPYLMSKYLALGMDIVDVIAMCTSNVARFIGKRGISGTLQEGVCADIAVMKLADKNVNFYDNTGEYHTGGQLFVPQMTILDGCVVYRNIEFNT